MSGRLGALAVVLALLLAGFVAVLVQSRTPGCTITVQRPALPPELRALGDFDQAYDAGQPSVIEDAAERAASAEYVNLIGTVPLAPVLVAGTGSSPDVLVVPLQSPSAKTIVGLVAFARDCARNAYFQTVENDVGAQPPVTSFPPVSRAKAEASLGRSPLRLEYTSSPLQPLWVATTSPPASVPAR